MVSNREEQNKKIDADRRQYVKDANKPLSKSDTCPKCGGKNVTSCPGGNSMKAVPGIWWICDDCKHQW